MAFRKAYLLLPLCLVSAILLNVYAAVDPTGVYRRYLEKLAPMTPPVAAMATALADGVYPWSTQQANGPAPQPTPQPRPEPTPEPEPAPVPEPEPVPVPEPEPQPQPEPGPAPVPEPDSRFTQVDASYFDDAVFIGDSRTVGMYEYGGLEETSTFYASTGLTVYKMFDSAIVSVPGQKKKITVEEALSEKQFAKIYLMIGINEMGTGTVESFMKAYGEAVQHLQELQPDAVIYLQAIMKVTMERSEQGDYITNEGIEARNAEIAKLADDRKIFFLDVNPLICDETGGMVASYTYDGVHLKAQYIPIWLDFLKEHAVE